MIDKRQLALLISRLSIKITRKQIAIPLILIWPWLLFASNSTWAFQNTINYFDSWIYLGYFLNLPDHVRYLGADVSAWFYFGSRFGWVLPGYLIYHILPPLLANLVLRFLVFYVSVFSIYATLKHTIGWRTGVFAALCLGSYSYFLLSIGWDYVDAGGITYSSLLFFLITYANVQQSLTKHRAIMVGVGIVAAALVFTNLFLGTILLSHITYYFLTRQHLSIRSFGIDACFAICGALLLTLLFCIINESFGGAFWFYGTSIEFARQVVPTDSNLWISKDYSWPLQKTYLIWPFLAFFAGLIFLCVPYIRKGLWKNRILYAGLIAHIVVILVYLIFNMRGATPVLAVEFYASYMIPTMVLALAVLSYPQLEKLSKRDFIWFTLWIAVLSVLALAFRSCGSMIYSYPNLSIFLIGCIWIIGIIKYSTRNWPLILFSLLFLILTPSAFSTYNTSYYCNAREVIQAHPQDTYLAAFQANDLFKQEKVPYDSFIWADGADSKVFRAITFIRLAWPYSMWSFPSLKGTFQEIPVAILRNRTIVFLTKDAADAKIAQEILRDQGIQTELTAQKKIEQDTEQLYIFVFKAAQ